MSPPGIGCVSHAGGRSGWNPNRASNICFVNFSISAPCRSVFTTTSSQSESLQRCRWASSAVGRGALPAGRRWRWVVIQMRARQSAALPTTLSFLLRSSFRSERTDSANPSASTSARAAARSRRNSGPASAASCWSSSGSASSWSATDSQAVPRARSLAADSRRSSSGSGAADMTAPAEVRMRKATDVHYTPRLACQANGGGIGRVDLSESTCDRPCGPVNSVRSLWLMDAHSTGKWQSARHQPSDKPDE